MNYRYDKTLSRFIWDVDAKAPNFNYAALLKLTMGIVLKHHRKARKIHAMPGPYLPPDVLPGACGNAACNHNTVGWCASENISDHCLNMRAYHDLCETCGQPMSSHMVCKGKSCYDDGHNGCGILVGPGHLEGWIAEGDVCNSCKMGRKYA